MKSAMFVCGKCGKRAHDCFMNLFHSRCPWCGAEHIPICGYVDILPEPIFVSIPKEDWPGKFKVGLPPVKKSGEIICMDEETASVLRDKVKESGQDIKVRVDSDLVSEIVHVRGTPTDNMFRKCVYPQKSGPFTRMFFRSREPKPARRPCPYCGKESFGKEGERKEGSVIRYKDGDGFVPYFEKSMHCTECGKDMVFLMFDKHVRCKCSFDLGIARIVPSFRGDSRLFCPICCEDLGMSIHRGCGGIIREENAVHHGPLAAHADLICSKCRKHMGEVVA